MFKKGVTLRGIEVFEALARSGSVADTAKLTGLSQPAVSQQMSNLESAIGAELIDHKRRPMRLTPAGQNFLRRASAALAELRLGQSELSVMDLAHLEELSFGIIDDFDNDLTPRLAPALADSLEGCRFRMITAGSKELICAMQERSLHMALSATSGQVMDGVLEFPVARDPFLIVAPRAANARPETLLMGEGPLPFLHYASDQLIARQIDSHLTRQAHSFQKRFEIGSHLALMAMVARGIGWSITTSLGYVRALEFHPALSAYPLPAPAPARQISLFAGAEWAGNVPTDIAQSIRHMMQTHMIAPVAKQLPWLGDSLCLIEG